MTIDEVKKRCENLAEQYGYKLDVPVEANGRIKSTLGRVKFQIKGKVCTPIKIEFSEELLKCSDVEVDETIRHEMAHFFVLKDTRANHNHDDVWKIWAMRLGARPRATVRRKGPYPGKETYRYIIECSKCGKVIGKYKRASKVVQNSKSYRSRCCNAKIRVKEII